MLSIKIDGIQELLSARMKLRKATQNLGSLRRRVENKPQLRDIPTSVVYDKLATRLGIHSKECELLLDAALLDPSDSFVDTLRKELTLAKLTNPGIVEPYRAQVAANLTLYESSVINWERDLAQREKLELEVAELTSSQPIADFRQEFINLIEDAQIHFEAHNNEIDRFEPDYRMFFNTLAQHSRFVSVEVDEESKVKKAKADWEAVSKFHIEHISGIFRSMAKQLEAAKNA